MASSSFALFDDKKAQDELLYVKSLLFFPHLSISVNVKRSFKSMKRYCQSSVSGLHSLNELFLFGIPANDLMILLDCHVILKVI